MNRQKTFEFVDPKRSATMSKIRSRGNRSTEKRLRAAIVREGISGWEMHPQDILGRPDFFFRVANIVVFVDGCFWHGCPKCYRRPKSRKAYWDQKISNNRERDEMINARLTETGFLVIRIWEHELAGSLGTVVARIKDEIFHRHQDRN